MRVVRAVGRRVSWLSDSGCRRMRARAWAEVEDCRRCSVKPRHRHSSPALCIDRRTSSPSSDIPDSYPSPPSTTPSFTPSSPPTHTHTRTTRMYLHPLALPLVAPSTAASLVSQVCGVSDDDAATSTTSHAHLPALPRRQSVCSISVPLSLSSYPYPVRLKTLLISFPCRFCHQGL